MKKIALSVLAGVFSLSAIANVARVTNNSHTTFYAITSMNLNLVILPPGAKVDLNNPDSRSDPWINIYDSENIKNPHFIHFQVNHSHSCSFTNNLTLPFNDHLVSVTDSNVGGQGTFSDCENSTINGINVTAVSNTEVSGTVPNIGLAFAYATPNGISYDTPKGEIIAPLPIDAGGVPIMAQKIYYAWNQSSMPMIAGFSDRSVRALIPNNHWTTLIAIPDTVFNLHFTGDAAWASHVPFFTIIGANSEGRILGYSYDGRSQKEGHFH